VPVASRRRADETLSAGSPKPPGKGLHVNDMKTIIIKIGTKVLSNTDGTLDEGFLEHLVGQMAALKKRGMRIILVTSGAVGAGKSLISLDEARADTVRKQVYAAVGQVKLMTTYSKLFSEHGYLCAQVLATKEDFRDDEHYMNMKNCFEGILLDDVIPIVNENDVVATTELLFTDNDELAGLVAKQLHADSLIILTGTDGILDREGKTVSEVDASTIERVESFITADTSKAGRGGMRSKFKTAKEVSEAGTVVTIVNGRRRDALIMLADGVALGTKFTAHI
jgi:glutamate 5-kinase